MSLCAACSFSGNPVATDGGPDVDGPPGADAPIDAVRIDAGPLGAWGAPAIVGELDDPGSDDDPTLTTNLLEIYWNSSRAGGSGGGDIWRATRGSVGETWTNIDAVDELNTGALESTPKLTVDGLTIYFNSDRLASGNFDIYVATRSSLSSSWNAPMRIDELSGPSGDYGAGPGEANTRIVFNSDRTGTAGGQDLYQSNRGNPNAPWGAPARITALSGQDNEYQPVLVDGDRTMYFQSDRDGSDDIFMAVRTSTGQPFMTPTIVDELSEPTASDADPWVSPDERTIFFASSRGGNMAIWQASR
jgi:Tol biopolymer transport system component